MPGVATERIASEPPPPEGKEYKRFHEQIRRSWNHVTPAHNSHKANQGEWLKQGGDTLFPEELGLLGDLEGRTLLHMQCNCGQDTISLARRGAVATGVDISDAAIEEAEKLSKESGIPATFIRSDLLDFFDDYQGPEFDVVFCSYGSVVWISDLERWAKGVAKMLKPGGKFAIVDFHPTCNLFQDDWKLADPEDCPMDPKVPLENDGIGDYVGGSGGHLSPSGHLEGVVDFENPEPIFEFSWSTSDIITELLKAGLQLTQFKEWPYWNGCALIQPCRFEEGNRAYPPEGFPRIPCMYGISALKALA